MPLPLVPAHVAPVTDNERPLGLVAVTPIHETVALPRTFFCISMVFVESPEFDPTCNFVEAVPSNKFILLKMFEAA